MVQTASHEGPPINPLIEAATSNLKTKGFNLEGFDRDIFPVEYGNKVRFHKKTGSSEVMIDWESTYDSYEEPYRPTTTIVERKETSPDGDEWSLIVEKYERPVKWEVFAGEYMKAGEILLSQKREGEDMVSIELSLEGEKDGWQLIRNAHLFKSPQRSGSMIENANIIEEKLGFPKNSIYGEWIYPKFDIVGEGKEAKLKQIEDTGQFDKKEATIVNLGQTQVDLAQFGIEDDSIPLPQKLAGKIVKQTVKVETVRE